MKVTVWGEVRRLKLDLAKRDLPPSARNLRVPALHQHHVPKVPNCHHCLRTTAMENPDSQTCAFFFFISRNLYEPSKFSILGKVMEIDGMVILPKRKAEKSAISS